LVQVGAEVISLLGLLEMSSRLSAVGKVRGGGRLSLNDASAILTRREQPCAVPRRGGGVAAAAAAHRSRRISITARRLTD